MADPCIAKVYTTTDHTKFKHLDGNREITEVRERKIQSSIEKYGYIFNPIIVNEKFEIIDGGGRQAVLQKMGLPVDYIVRPGLSVKDCQALNTASTTWKQLDYINSFADLGNLNYIYLRNLIIRFPEIPVTSILSAVTNTVTANNKVIMSGELECSEDQYNMAAEVLSYVNKFIGIIQKTKTKTRTNLVLGALMFARRLEFVDHDRLYNRFVRLYPSDLITDMQNIDSVLRGLSTIYNYQHRGKKIYFETEYKQYMSENVSFYATRYGGGNKKEVV